MTALEQFCVQQHQYNTLTHEQNGGEHNPLFETAYDMLLRHAGTWTEHPSPAPFSLPPSTETHTGPTQLIP
jgi:hypothetical protein